MPRPGRMTTERARDFQGTLRQLLKALGRYKISLGVVVVFAVLSTIFNIAGPKVLAQATTALATGWVAKLRGHRLHRLCLHRPHSAHSFGHVPALLGLQLCAELAHERPFPESLLRFPPPDQRKDQPPAPGLL